MPILLSCLELFVVCLATWVMTFEVVLYSRAPWGFLLPSFLLSLIPVLIVLGRTWWRRFKTAKPRARWLASRVLLLGLALSALVLVVSRPDLDDVGYFGPPLLDAAEADGPLAPAPFKAAMGSQKVIVPWLNDYEAYEPLVVVLSSALGLDPLQAYHNWFPVLLVPTWLLVYALLLRHFRVRGRWFWLGLGALLVLLLLDGNLHRSFGNTTLLRIWQGKVIMWAILIPAYLLFCLRFLSRRSWRDWILMLALVLASVHINRSALFLFLALGLAAPLAYLLSYGPARRRLSRSLLASAAVAPLVLALVVGILTIPELTDGFRAALATGQSGQSLSSSSIWTSRVWWQNLDQWVLGSTANGVRDLVLLLLVPLLALRRPGNRFLPLFCLAIVLIAINPLTGPFWHLFSSRAYWRMVYLFPLPLCFGLVPLLLRPGSRLWSRRLVLAMVLLTYGLGFEKTVFSSADSVVELKAPAEYRFPARHLSFSRLAASQLQGRTVVAPNEIASILGLTHSDTINLPFSRVQSATSYHGKAHGWVCGRRTDPANERSILRLLKEGVDSLVVRNVPKNEQELHVNSLPGYRLELRTRALGYSLWFVEEEP